MMRPFRLQPRTRYLMLALTVGGAMACRHDAASSSAPVATTGPAETAPSESGARAAPESPAPPPFALDERDQYALVAELLEAQATPNRDERDQALGRVASAWRHHRYRWEVGLLPQLCRTAERCNVLPLDYAALDRPVVQGWLPRLELDRAQLGAIEAACRPYERCVVRFEGTLSHLQASVELPTALTFSNVRLLGARGQWPDESFFRREPPGTGG